MKSPQISIYLIFIVFFSLVLLVPNLNIRFKSDLETYLESQREFPVEHYETANRFLQAKIFNVDRQQSISLSAISNNEQSKHRVILARYRTQKSTYGKNILVTAKAMENAVADLASKLSQIHGEDPIVGLKVYYPFGGLFPSDSLKEGLANNPELGLFAALDHTNEVIFTPSEILFRNMSVLPPLVGNEQKMSREQLESNDDWSYFFVKAFWISPTDIAALYREHLLESSTHPNALLTAAQKAGDSLLADLNEHGQFVYLKFGNSKKNDYNILRHAGTLWALADLHHEVSHVSKRTETKYLDGWHQGLKYLLSHVKPCTHNTQISCIIENNEIKIGGAALAILALTAMNTSIRDDISDDTASLNNETKILFSSYLRSASLLGEWLLSELGEDGKFRAHKFLADPYTKTDFWSEYYPGEAAFALMKLFHITGEVRWQEAAKKIIHAQTTDQQSLTTDQAPHDHWLLYALSSSQKSTIIPKEFDHMLFLVNLMVNKQIKDLNTQLDWIGGYDEFPRSTPAAVRTEGLAAAYPILQRAGQNDVAQKVLDTILRGINFQLKTQIGPEIAMELPFNSNALGAFRKDLYLLETRIDYSQHQISALLAARRLLLLDQNAH